MKVVNISLDPKILNKDTPAAARARKYAEAIDEYIVIVPAPQKQTVLLADRAVVYGVGGRNKLVQLVRMYILLRRLAKEERCDVITSTDFYYIGLVSLIIARQYHLGLEVSVLGVEKLTPLRKYIASFVLKRVSVVRALSQRLKKRLATEFGVTETEINVIPIHVPIDTLGFSAHTFSLETSAQQERLQLAFKETYGKYFNFLAVSRLIGIKRIELQLEALAVVRKELPQAFLHIVGEGPEEASLKIKAKELGVREAIMFHGRKTGNELGMFYLECDCFLLTSDYEGWGMVVVEAATAGLPIIMTDVGCAEEFITDEKSGLVIPVNDSGALKEAMKRVITDTALREQLSYGTKTALASLETFDTIITRYVSNWEIAHNNTL